jgi:hypothetical protein
MWADETLWQQIIQWRQAGKTYAEIIELLSEVEAMRQFKLHHVPSEGTIRKGLQKRLQPAGVAPQ